MNAEQITPELLKLVYFENGYTFASPFTQPIITGWRNKSGRPNYFDDFISVYNVLNEDFAVYPATTFPGTYWLKRLLNPKGTAILAPNQYRNVYRLGYYRGKLALLQVRELTVYRDPNGDDRFNFDDSTLDTGMFGLHIHSAGNNSMFVDMWSAGCQVFQRYADFIDMCQRFLTGTATMSFHSYTLVEV